MNILIVCYEYDCKLYGKKRDKSSSNKPHHPLDFNQPQLACIFQSTGVDTYTHP